MPDSKGSYLFCQNWWESTLFCQNFEKYTLVAGHFILNQIFKNVEIGQLVIHTNKNTLDGNGSGLAEASHLRNGAWLCQISEETLRNGAWQPDPCFLNARY